MDSEGKTWNWTEAVEDYIEEGETEKAISLLETLISELEKGTLKAASSSSSYDDELITALLDLAKLYSSKGLSLKADQTRQRAIRIDQESQDDTRGLNVATESTVDVILEYPGLHPEALTCNRISQGHKHSSDLLNDSSSKNESLEDADWEAIADRAPDELLSRQCLPEVSQLSLEDKLEDKQVQGPKRRGRGTFSYGRPSLYSDDFEEKADAQFVEEEDTRTEDLTSMKYGTRHVVVLSGFSPRTTTTDLEKLFDKFKNRGFAIRWVNDTVALAVFSSPSTALEACTSIDDKSFTVRQLDEDDELLKSITKRELEPPRPRPKTSARTAQRLIAQSMGLKLPSSPSTFSSRELRQQEAARKNRIVSRQNLRDDAWGDDS